MSTPWWRHEVLGNYLVFGPMLLVLVFFAPFMIASQFALAQPVAAVLLDLLLYAVGLTLFVIAKLSVIRQGVRLSSGSKHMGTGHRWLYRLGYLLMLTGLFLSLAILFAAARTTPGA
jgi:uncharacterized membrane protein YbhN (UPF0104 family)